jgi:uncharacterized membrane protein
MRDDARSQDAADRPVFAAEIRPHRSLTPRGRAVLLGGFGALTALISLPFLWMGAWPVVGFFGLDVFALWLALRLNVAHARACENVLLTHVELLIRKTTHRGDAREWRFNPRWVRVMTEVDDEFGTTRLCVAERDAAPLDLAASLSPRERSEFAGAFRQALAVAKAGRTLS